MTPEERADTICKQYPSLQTPYGLVRDEIVAQIKAAEEAAFTETLEAAAQYLEEAMADVTQRGHAPLDKVLCVEDVQRLAREIRGYKS